MSIDQLGPNFEASVGGHRVAGRRLAATETPSYSHEVLPGKLGGCFAFFKASGLGPVPAAIANDAAARFREQISGTAGAGRLTKFARELNNAVPTVNPGKIVACTLGSITEEGEVVIVPAGNPDIFVWRNVERSTHRLKFQSAPALGVMPSEVLVERRADFKAFKVLLNPADRLVFVHGEFVEASVVPAIQDALSAFGLRGAGPVLDSIVANLREESREGQVSTWPAKPINDSFIIMLSRENAP